MTSQQFSLADFDLQNVVQQTPVDFQEVHVEVHPQKMLADFSEAFLIELERANQRLVDTVQITEEELNQYFTDLIYLRVLDVNRKAGKFRKYLRSLLMPAWLQFAVSQIGLVSDEAYGLQFTPTMKERDVDIDGLTSMTTKLSHFRNAGVELLDGGFPKDDKGSKDFMTMSVIQNRLCSYRQDNDPLSMYLAGFLGSTVQELDTLNALYRITYQDVSYVEQVLRMSGGLVK